jgi:hypothetical protein
MKALSASLQYTDHEEMLYRSPFLQTLRQCPEVVCGNFHRFVRSRAHIKHALLLDVCLKCSASMTIGVASGIAESSSFAGLDASASHCGGSLRGGYEEVNTYSVFRMQYAV